MKNFKTALIALTLALSTFTNFAQAAKNANSREIERKVNVLAKIAYGAQAHNLRAGNAEEMIIQLAMKENSETRADVMERFTRNIAAKEVSIGEMPGWGTMKIPAAIKLYASMDQHRDEAGEDQDNSKALAVGESIIRELGKMGVTFGFTQSTSSYCGVSFGGLLVVDEEADTVYEIALTDSGSC